MANKKLKDDNIQDFPYKEKEYTIYGERLVNIIKEYHIRQYGEKLTWEQIKARVDLVIEGVKR